MQLKNKYILSPVKSGLMVIDQKRAHEQILYEKFINSLSGEGRLSQKSLFPQVIELSAEDHHLLFEFADDINKSGFDINDFGNNSIVVNGCPSEIENPNPAELIRQMLEEMHSNPQQPAIQSKQYLAGILSKSSSIPYGKALSNQEMRDLIDKLFACSNHNYTHDGKSIITIISTDEFEKRLK